MVNIFVSHSQGVADSNSLNQQQIPSWYLTPQKLQVGRVSFSCLSMCTINGLQKES